MTIIKRGFRFFFKTYAVICSAIFSVILIYILFLLMALRFDYAELPNGTLLMQKGGLFRTHLMVKTPDGREIIPAEDDDIKWNARYTAGLYHDKCLLTPCTSKNIRFIYKAGATRAELFDLDDSSASRHYTSRLEETGLADFGMGVSFAELRELGLLKNWDRLRGMLRDAIKQ